MIIIIEGPDNAGKSTLAKRLGEELGLDVIHPGGRPKDTEAALVFCLTQGTAIAFGDVTSMIYDRITAISDDAYRARPTLSKMYREFRESINDYAAESKAFIVYCRPPLQKLLDFSTQVQKSHKDAEHVEFAKANAGAIIDRYDKMMTELKPNVIFDYTAADADAKYKFIVNSVKAKL